nr:kynureninase [Polymorphobacter sp.]
MMNDGSNAEVASLTRAACEAMDAADPIAALRDAFLVPERTIYLDGNSLGAMPKVALERAMKVTGREWGSDLISSWNTAGWFDMPTRLGDKVGRLTGADDGEVVVCDSTGVNLFKLVWAAATLRPERSTIILEGSNFPTNNYIAQGIAASSGGRVVVRFVEADDIMAAIDIDTVAVCMTHVHYKYGHVHDMAAITAKAHAMGALAIWDLCHSAGAMPITLNACGVDFAVGCTYKYLNGGPGAPAFLFAARRHHAMVQQPVAGWWGHAEPFAFERDYRAHDGIKQFLVGTPPVLSMAVAEVGLDIQLAADAQQLRVKSMALTDLFIRLVEARCGRHGLALASPRNAAERGSQVSFAHPQGYPIMRALIDAGVIGDFRAPDIMRFGFAALYVRFIDVWDAVDRLDDILETGRWQRPEFLSRDAVT